MEEILDRARLELVKRWSQSDLGALCAASSAPWNEDGFYRARSYSFLKEQGVFVEGLDLAFDVEASDPSWGEPFVYLGKICRTLHRQARLPWPQRPWSRLRIEVFNLDGVAASASMLWLRLGAQQRGPARHGPQEDGFWAEWDLSDFESPNEGQVDFALICTSPVIVTNHYGRHNAIISAPQYS